MIFYDWLCVSVFGCVIFKNKIYEYVGVNIGFREFFVCEVD